MPNKPQEKSPRSISFIRLCNLCFLRNTLRKIPGAATDQNTNWFFGVGRE